MAAVSKLHLSPQTFLRHLTFKDPSLSDHPPKLRPLLRRNPGKTDGILSLRQRNGRRRPLRHPCRAFRSENGGESTEKRVEKWVERDGVVEEKNRSQSKKGKGILYSLKSLLLKASGSEKPVSGEKCQSAVAKLEEIFFSVVTQFGRYLLTMTSTGVILAVGFQLSGGDSQMNTLIWYSWLGGIIIGTMIGANMVLEEHCRAGPRNVVITGSTRGLGKALAREFLLSGDRVVVASRSPESVHTTVGELEEDLKKGILTAGSMSKLQMARAKVVGIACDVCEPEDVRKLANFAASKLGSIDIWINNAGTNKGFRPLLQFTDEDIDQVSVS